MPSLLEALSDGSFDLLTKRDTGSDFAKKLQLFKNVVMDQYLNYNIDLNMAIAKLAEKNNLNDDQIQRIVEEVNNQVYLVKYNRMKDSPDRDVEFDIASVPKIKEICNNGDTKKSVYKSGEKEASGNSSGMYKKASWENDDVQGDKLNFLNYSSHDFSCLSPEVFRSRDSILAEKIANTIKEKESNFKKITEKLAADTYTVVEALIKYDRFGLDAQSIYENICKEASITKSNQIMFKSALTQKVAQMKECGELPSNYDLGLEFYSYEKTADEFSLGKYSLIKQASASTQSNERIPVITTDRKVIKNVNQLINLAKDVQTQKDEAKSKYSELKNIKEKTANVSMQELEKLASGGIATFGKAFLGTTKREAGKALNEASSHLSALKSNSKLIEADKAVSDLENAIKDVGHHSRMNNVKQELRNAQDKLNAVNAKHDKVLNDAATQNPVKRIFNSDYHDAKNEIKSAKNDVHMANKKNIAQQSRLENELGDQYHQAKNKANDISDELGVRDAENKVNDAKKAFDKATRATKKARTVTAFGVGVPAAIGATKALDNKQDTQGAFTY